MAFRSHRCRPLAFAVCLSGALTCVFSSAARAQVFVVGEKTATADVSTDFKPTRLPLPSKPINELGRRELVRNLEAEQGFAHRALPIWDGLVLQANGALNPNGDEYRQMIYKKGQAVAPGDRVVLTTVTIKANRIILDVNGGPYLKHRFLRHLSINDTSVVRTDDEYATGSRIALVFEGGIPDIGAPEVKALLEPLLDFGVKTSEQAYGDTLPEPLKDAIAVHDVLVGMNRRMVIAALGAPETKVRELVPNTTTDQHYEEWIYGHMPETVRFVRFDGDRVVEVRVAALGKAIEIHDKDELAGYLDPQSTREVAYGDSKASDPDHAAPAPPTLLKPGEGEAPGSSSRVQYPVPAKPVPTGDDKPSATPDAAPASPAAGSQPTASSAPAPTPNPPQYRVN